MTVIKLDTSDISVERRPDGRIDVMIYGGDVGDVQLDLHPGVAEDFAAALMNPEEP